MGVVRQRLAVIRSAIGPSRPGRLGKMDIERLVGSIRRECINDVIVLGKVHRAKVSNSMRITTTAYERISLSTKTHQSIAPTVTPGRS
jgi:hypothetical protein